MTVATAAPTAPDRYFGLLRHAYRSAAERHGQQVLELSVATSRLRVVVASEGLARTLVGPLRRLLGAADGHPAAVVHAWDSSDPALRPPSIPWRPSDVLADGRVEGFDGGRFRCSYRDDGAGYHAVSMFDQQTRDGFFWFADHAHIHWYERAEPLRTAIHWALAGAGRFLAHASAVGDEHGAVLLTGKGGSGKTTTTLSSVGAGLRFVGDNYVLLSLKPGENWVHGLYGDAKLWPQTLDQLPELRPFVRSFDVAEDEKLLVDVVRFRPDQVVPGLPVRAVVVPEVVGCGPTRLAPCSAVEALLALAPATIFQLPRTEHGMAGMAELVRRVPTYRLELGGDPIDAPGAVGRLLGELSG